MVAFEVMALFSDFHMDNFSYAKSYKFFGFSGKYYIFPYQTEWLTLLLCFITEL